MPARKAAAIIKMRVLSSHPNETDGKSLGGLYADDTFLIS